MTNRILRIVLAGLFVATLAPAAAPPAHAQPAAALVVDYDIDEADANPGDGVCLSTPSAMCTLRAAVQESNLLPGSDTITFAITGTVYLMSTLTITDSVTITGPGAEDMVWGLSPESNTRALIFQKVGGQFTVSGIHMMASATARGVLINSGILTLDDVYLEGLQIGPALEIFAAGAGARVLDSTFDSNINSPAGGAILNQNGTLFVTDSMFSNNRATFFGAAIHNSGSATIANSSFVYNWTIGGFGGGDGGGLYNSGQMTVTNSTIYSNTLNSDPGSQGGGIANVGTLTLASSTLSHNSAVPGNGGGLAVLGGTVTIRNTIIAHSTTGGDCVVAGGSLVNGGNNLVEDNSCGFTGGTDPLLGDLADNGGPTLTMALQAGSPAIDTGNPAGCAGGGGFLLGSDQRGYFRHADGDSTGSLRCDKGAYEYNAAFPTHWANVPLVRR